MTNEKPCRYCGFVAARQSDDDCAMRPLDLATYMHVLARDGLAWRIAKDAAEVLAVCGYAAHDRMHAAACAMRAKVLAEVS